MSEEDGDLKRLYASEPDAQPTPETVLARSIAQLAGRDPRAFHARLSGASVHVSGPVGAARYPHEHWQELFRAHLEAGFYDIRGSATGKTP